jgi:hypothetical protein
MEGEGEGSFAWWPMEGEGEGSFLPIPTFPPKQLYLNLHFLSFDIKVLLYHGPSPFFTHSFLSLAYKSQSRNLMSQVPRTFIINLTLLKIFLLFLANMASHMVTSYGPQVAQANEEPPSESSLDLTLMQHPRDKELKPQEVHVYFEVEPPRTWYYRISPNSRTLVILL